MPGLPLHGYGHVLDADVVEKNMNKTIERNFNIFVYLPCVLNAKIELTNIYRDENDKKIVIKKKEVGNLGIKSYRLHEIKKIFCLSIGLNKIISSEKLIWNGK